MTGSSASDGDVAGQGTGAGTGERTLINYGMMAVGGLMLLASAVSLVKKVRRRP